MQCFKEINASAKVHNISKQERNAPRKVRNVTIKESNHQRKLDNISAKVNNASPYPIPIQPVNSSPTTERI